MQHASSPSDASLAGTLASRRLQLLTAAGELLSSSLDYGQTLQHVAHLALPALGDLCVVDVHDGVRLQRVATAHVSEAKVGLLEQLARHYPASDGSPAPAARAFAAGRTHWMETVTLEDIETHTVDARHAALIRGVGMRSHLAVPMVARNTTVGVISLGITESDRRYGPEDIALAEELARRAALAIDNARLYQQARQDLEERRRVEVQLRRSEARFRALIEQSPLSTQLLDRDGRTIAVNAAWESLWGLRLDDLGDYNILHDPQLDEAGITPLLRRAFAGEPVNLPLAPYDPDRTLPDRSSHPSPLRWVRAFAYPVRDANGTVQEVALVHEDVTEARNADARLRESENRLHRALSIGRMNAWDWHLDSNVITCSASALEFWGRDHGTPGDFLALVHPDDRERVDEMNRASINEGAPYDIEYRLQSADGSVRWVRSRGDVERDADGRPVRVLGITADISEHKRAEQATRLLADAGETLGASLDYQITLTQLATVLVPGIADWYAVDLLTPEGDLERVSVAHPDPARVEMAKSLHRRYPSKRGMPHGAWHVIETGQPDWAEHISDEILQRVAHDETHLALLRGLALRSYVCAPLKARGITIGVITLVFAESGRRYGQADIGLVMEVARRAAVAVDNARLFHDLQMADRRKDEFLAMLAHELRNPLAPISTAAQLLRIAAGTDRRVLGASEIISRQVSHMTELVDDLLDVSRVTRGLVELEKQPVDLKSVVAGAVEQAQTLIEARRHALGIWTSAEPLVVEGDRARLIQVIANLLNNAAKYTPPGGMIELRVDGTADHVRIVVRDNGIGIERSLLPHVFELFTQAQRTPDRSQGGLGIGLALVRSIVRLHEGEVRAESTGSGQGSVFTVVLPRAQRLPAPGPNAATAVSAAPGSRRVLVVDDNADAATMLAEVLQLHGHCAVVATSATEALATVDRTPGFDLFVLDIGLPDMTGYELAAALRQRVAPARPTLVALTGYGQQHNREQAVLAGFDGYLVKPADVDRLLEWLRGVDARHEA